MARKEEKQEARIRKVEWRAGEAVGEERNGVDRVVPWLQGILG